MHAERFQSFLSVSQFNYLNGFLIISDVIVVSLCHRLLSGFTVVMLGNGRAGPVIPLPTECGDTL